MPIKVDHKFTFFIFAYWHDKNWKKFVGATVKIWDLAHNISSFGHQVVLFLPKYQFEKQNLPFKIVEIPIIKMPILSFISFNLCLCFVLIFKFTRFKVDIMYVRRGISVIPLLYARFKKIFLVFEVNDNPYRKNRDKQTNLIASLRYKLSIKSDLSYLKFSDLNCVITKKIRNIITNENPLLQKNKFYILPSGSNTKVFRPLSKRESRLYLNLSISSYYIGFVGTLLYYSGVETLIDAVPYIRKEIPNCYFSIIGEGPLKNRLMNLTIKKGLQDCITFEGQIEYELLPAYINSFDICVAPYTQSVGYSSPVKIFDYMACEKPVIASKIIGTTDSFEQSGAISLIEPQNSSMLAKSVIHLLKNSKMAYEMGAKGRQLIVNKYDRNLLTKKMILKIKDNHQKKAFDIDINQPKIIQI